MKKLIAIPLLCGLLLGCDNKAELLQFEAASKDALSAPDPFLALDKFDEKAGDYGKNCGGFFGELLSDISSNQRAACEKRLAMQIKIVVASVDKGSLPAFLFLLNEGPKYPPVYLNDLPVNYAHRQRARLFELAWSLPPAKENAELFRRAAEDLQTGNNVMQDSTAAIALYKKAWQAGDESAADNLSDVYAFLGDTPRAYFWKIRAHSLPEYTKDVNKLTPEEKIIIQRKAADATRTDI
ncbi:hypothetical protein ABK814_21675 [Enterobacter hormaechei]|uniref:hypothetical protein n=1 Tax=Enterobacter hormaechei TaxID=158836 RepID=UPI0012C0517E|nr:hypothetical protein [Salmonella enterica subsp. enterica serovar Enteritidis]HAJ3766099.1 hypothetical protein [Escherichia coli]HAJ6041578.1 hypothetical protein [Escherichia coli]HEK7528314.1 hypothetical protein [Escherichia coli]